MVSGVGSFFWLYQLLVIACLFPSIVAVLFMSYTKWRNIRKKQIVEFDLLAIFSTVSLIVVEITATPFFDAPG